MKYLTRFISESTNKYKNLYNDITKLFIDDNVESDEIDKMVTKWRQKLKDSKVRINPDEPRILIQSSDNTLSWYRYKVAPKTAKELKSLRNKVFGVFYDDKFIRFESDDTYNKLIEILEKNLVKNEI